MICGQITETGVVVNLLDASVLLRVAVLRKSILG